MLGGEGEKGYNLDKSSTSASKSPKIACQFTIQLGMLSKGRIISYSQLAVRKLRHTPYRL